ncbi:MAG: methyltransferase domain-containing protein [Acidobacteria bacterium]|nr:methyltransferase domain-containing protein [Acidobacteriota bacterium]MCI0623072.1 methyltransferase domain-containing protein [Acidobacteriota bacterium]MCI0721838.1 methyltransferase domain-containing protein [Acidobacteriota bacterium]
MLKDVTLFYSQFRDSFTTTGAIAPSSPLLGKAITHPLSQRPSRPVRVLEVGAGTGAFTRQILKHLRAGDQLDIYELNSRFCDYLRAHPPWQECALKGIFCRLHNADVRGVSTESRYDYIVCGLPFNNFEPEVVSEILSVLIERLSPEGVFSYFEYIFSHEFKSRFLKPSDRQRMIRVGAIVRAFIRKHQFGYRQVWLNLPPAKARYCRKAAQT